MIANQVGLKFYGVDCYVTAVLQERMIEIAKEMYEASSTYWKPIFKEEDLYKAEYLFQGKVKVLEKINK